MRSLQGRNTMTSQPIRDQVEDHLITPKNAALLIIDYQPPQVSSIVSMDHRTLVANIVAVARLAKLFALPIVLSTVNVKTGLSAPTIHQLAEVLEGIEELDRTTINAWEDEEFVTAVKATGRKKAHHGRAVDGSLPQFSRARRHARRVRGLPGGGRGRRHLRRGAPGRARAHRAGWRTTHQRGSADL